MIDRLKIIFIALGFMAIGVIGCGFDKVWAANYQIANTLEIVFDDNYFFNSTNLYPGVEVHKTLSVKNIGIYNHSFSIATSGVSGNLAEVLQIEPRVNGNAVWNKTLSQIAQSPQTDLIIPNISPNQTVNIDIAAILPSNVGNNYSGSSVSSFNFDIGNESTDQIEPSVYSQSSTQISSSSRTRIPAFGRTYSAANSTPSPDSTISPTSSPTITEGTVLADENNAVKGAEDVNQSKLPSWWLWIIILLALIVLYLFFYHRRKKDKEK